MPSLTLTWQRHGWIRAGAGPAVVIGLAAVALHACTTRDPIGTVSEAYVKTEAGLPDWDAGWDAISKWNCDRNGNGSKPGTCLAGYYYDPTANCDCCVKGSAAPTPPAGATNVLVTPCDGTGCKFPSYCKADGKGGCDVTESGANAIWLSSYNAGKSCIKIAQNDLCLLPQTGCMLVAQNIDTSQCKWPDPAASGQSPECGNMTCTGQDAFYCLLPAGTSVHYAPVDVSQCDPAKKCAGALVPRTVRVAEAGTAIDAATPRDAGSLPDASSACGPSTCGGCEPDDPTTNPAPAECDCVPCGAN